MDYLYLKWVDQKSQKKYLLGALYKKDGKYYFKLSKEHIEKALNEKAYSKVILPFKDLDRIYESDTIFAIFKIRLPDLNKYSEEELKMLLQDLNMNEYDEFEYLEKTKGKLMIDNYIVEKEKE